MKPLPLIFTGVALAGSLLAGCAVGQPDTTLASCGSNYSCMTDKTFEYRQQAAKLAAIAQRYEMEAEVRAKELGRDAQQVKQSRDRSRRTAWSTSGSRRSA